MNWADTKEMTEALKNFATLILYIIVIFFFAFAIWPRIKDFEIKKVSLAGVELGPKEKQAIQTIDSLSTNLNHHATDTAKIPFKFVAAAKLIDTTFNFHDRSWVYLGQKVNGKLTNSHFQIKDLPESGDTITAMDAVYKRKDLPLELKNGNWKLGDIRGVVTDNEAARVISVKEIADKNYWGLIENNTTFK